MYSCIFLDIYWHFVIVFSCWTVLDTSILQSIFRIMFKAEVRCLCRHKNKKRFIDYLLIMAAILWHILPPPPCILPVVLYGCETWSLTLREERKLRVFENIVLRRIFGPRRDEVTGEWRRLHNEELNDLYSSPNIVRMIKSRRMRWAGHVARMGEERGGV